MLCCARQKVQVDPDEAKKNKVIEKSIRNDAQDYFSTIKLLLLGAGESGKSTFFKQLKIIHQNGFNDKEREELKNLVYANILTNALTLLDACNNIFNIPLQTENKESARRLEDIDAMYCDEAQFLEVAPILKELWNDAGIQLAASRGSEFNLNDSTEYFFLELDRIAQPRYIPTEQDILRIRVKTSGVTELQFTIQNNRFLAVDVGGQRSERRKWIHFFDNVAAMIFFASLSDYDQKLHEDENVNRMSESLKLFGDIANYRAFNQTSIILFLNKKDIFINKIKRVPISVYFKDYKGPNEYEESLQYVREQFLLLAPKKQVYVHATTATDTNNIKVVFRAVREIIVTQNLKTLGLIDAGFQTRPRDSSQAAQPIVKAPTVAPIEKGSVIGFTVGGAKGVDVFRESIKMNLIPTMDSITVEGMFSDYFFDTGAPCGEVPKDKFFYPTYGIAQSKDPFSKSEEIFMTVGFNSTVSSFERLPLSVIFLLDSSGSMSSPFDTSDLESPPRIDVAREAIESLLRQLKKTDLLCLMTFADTHDERARLDKITPSTAGMIGNKLNNIRPNGSTNFAVGYKHAVQEMMKELPASKLATSEHRIIVFSDTIAGSLNAANRSSTFNLIREAAQSNVFTTVVFVSNDSTQLEGIEQLYQIRGFNIIFANNTEEFRKKTDAEFKFWVMPMIFDLRIRMVTSAFEIVQVLGAPHEKQNTKQLLTIPTLFPSATNEEGQVKGGVVLLRLRKKPSTEFDMKVTLAYATRASVTEEVTTNVAFPAQVTSGDEYYPSLGIRKAILLSRYAILMKIWINNHRKESPVSRKTIDENGVLSSLPLKGDVRSHNAPLYLQASEEEKAILKSFAEYFDTEAKSVKDESLSGEFEIINAIIDCIPLPENLYFNKNDKGVESGINNYLQKDYTHNINWDIYEQLVSFIQSEISAMRPNGNEISFENMKSMENLTVEEITFLLQFKLEDRGNSTVLSFQSHHNVPLNNFKYIETLERTTLKGIERMLILFEHGDAKTACAAIKKSNLWIILNSLTGIPIPSTQLYNALRASLSGKQEPTMTYLMFPDESKQTKDLAAIEIEFTQ